MRKKAPKTAILGHFRAKMSDFKAKTRDFRAFSGPMLKGTALMLKGAFLGPFCPYVCVLHAYRVGHAPAAGDLFYWGLGIISSVTNNKILTR